jgi:hypothetical protein
MVSTISIINELCRVLPLCTTTQEGHAFDQHSKPIPLGSNEKVESIKKARTALQMHRIIGQDSWVVVPLSSVSRPGHQLEGTRLTLVKVPNQPDAVEFSIRTPVTPPRWKDYDQELEAAWEGLVGCLLQGDLAGAARGILTFGYYWYNFMPLARGTAAVGYTTILALFWAAGVPVCTPIPKDYQVWDCGWFQGVVSGAELRCSWAFQWYQYCVHFTDQLVCRKALWEGLMFGTLGTFFGGAASGAVFMLPL